MNDFINPDFLDSDAKYQFVVVLKNGERIRPSKMTADVLNEWLRHPSITFTPPEGEEVKFAHEDIARVEL